MRPKKRSSRKARHEPNKTGLLGGEFSEDTLHYHLFVCLLDVQCGQPSICSGRPSILVGVGSRVLHGPCRRLLICLGSVCRLQVRVGSGLGRIRVPSGSRMQTCVDQ